MIDHVKLRVAAREEAPGKVTLPAGAGTGLQATAGTAARPRTVRLKGRGPGTIIPLLHGIETRTGTGRRNTA